MTLRRPLTAMVPAVALVALAMPPVSSAQTTFPTRTFVAGTGNDQNPCSRAAPCRSFGGALAKTASGGVINILSTADYGGLTIDKPITIRARGGTGGITADGGTAITINAPRAHVTLDGLEIHGGRTGTRTIPMGVRVLSAARVKILESEISRFSTGVALLPSAEHTSVLVRGSTITENGIGLLNAPAYRSATLPTTLTARRNTISDNGCGVASGAFGPNAAVPSPNPDCGTAPSGNVAHRVVTRLFRNDIEENAFGVFGRGLQSTTDLVRNDITDNTRFGLRRIDGATMRTTSPPTNVLINPADDAPNGTIGLG